ncbi:MAG: accessory gene regulator B family protein [Clostridiales bacterium]|nr:accessory gene regulator B family protein [Clostridiales bacterium]
MKIIDKLSFAGAARLARQLDESHQKRRVYYYGFQIVFGGVFKFVILCLLTTLLGVFIPTITVLIFFASLRIIAGGYHFDKFNICLIISLLIFIVFGVFSQYTYPFWPPWALYLLSGAVFFFGLNVLSRWAPADTQNKPITNPEDKKKFKKLSLIHICIWFPFVSLLIYFNSPLFALASCLGVTFAIFIVSPAGYSFFSHVNKLSRKSLKNIKLSI